MGYYITHSLANGLTCRLSQAKPGEYAVYDPAGKFYAYAKNIKIAHAMAKNFIGERITGTNN
jgi:hypothetical protein